MDIFGTFRLKMRGWNALAKSSDEAVGHFKGEKMQAKRTEAELLLLLG
jgi:hypothetical protein